MIAGLETKFNDTTFMKRVNVSKQENLDDCGAHVIANAYCFVDKKSLPQHLLSRAAIKWIEGLIKNNPAENTKKSHQKLRKNLCSN